MKMIYQVARNRLVSTPGHFHLIAIKFDSAGRRAHTQPWTAVEAEQIAGQTGMVHASLGSAIRQARALNTQLREER
jgi:hypothetical protein